MFRKILLLFIIHTVVISGAAQINNLRINQYRVLGSHNSYKLAIEKPLFAMLMKVDSARIKTLDYSHLTFTQQLDMGVRALEIDVYYDPQGGRYQNPMGLRLLKEAGIIPLPFDQKNKLALPGLKVFHVQDIDFRSSQLLFTDALREIKNWMRAHSGHHPIYITMNAKDEIIDNPGFVKPLPFTKKALDSIDIEIRTVFTDKELITPDAVRGNANTLEKAVLETGWPELKDANNKILFLLDERGDKMNAYMEGHPSLKGRAMFVAYAQPGTPEAAFIIMNDAIADEAEIKNLVAKGYFIRTRADADTYEARIADYTRYKAAIRSRAQIISTDYYGKGKHFGKNYRVFFKTQNNN